MLALVCCHLFWLLCMTRVARPHATIDERRARRSLSACRIEQKGDGVYTHYAGYLLESGKPSTARCYVMGDMMHATV